MPASFYKHGHGRSRNARIAESEGRAPLTRAAQAVAQSANCTQAVAKEACRLTWDGEYHHVGKFAAEVEYYDVQRATVAAIVFKSALKQRAKRRATIASAKKLGVYFSELGIAADMLHIDNSMGRHAPEVVDAVIRKLRPYFSRLYVYDGAAIPLPGGDNA